jgi:hypothetical protein
MSEPIEIILSDGAYKSSSKQLSHQTCINWYPDTKLLERGGASPSALLPTPGLTLFSSIPGNQVREVYSIDNERYAVVDNKAYYVDRNGNYTELGTLNTIDTPLSIISNKTQVKITDTLYGYVIDRQTKVFTQITDPHYTPESVLTYQDGYSIGIVPTRNEFQVSAPNNFTTYTSDGRSGIVGDNSQLLACATLREELYLFTNKRAEVWSNEGGVPIPFGKNINTLVQFGIAAPYTLVNCDNTLYWLGVDETKTLSFVSLDGYDAKVVSDEGINLILSRFKSVSDARSFAYGQDGHLFICTEFPKEDRTIVYDVVADEWHERSSTIGGVPSNQGRWRATSFTTCEEVSYVGDRLSGNIYILDPNVFNENGDPIIRERTSAVFSDKSLNRVVCDLLIVDCETGVGTAETPDPQLMLQVSHDGGVSFGAQRFYPLGKKGKYTHQVRFTRLGMARKFAVKLQFSGDCYASLFNGVAWTSPGTS